MIRVENMLNELRKKENYTMEQVEKESRRVYELAQQTGKVYSKVFAAVPLELIHIDEGYQRTENFSKAKGDQIAFNFKEEVYEPVKLNYRDGAFYCPSGQHRIYAHIKMGREYIVSELISCPREAEIAVFLYQDDNRSKLTPYDRWKAGCELGMPTDKTLKEICLEYGVSLGKVSGKARLGSITTARQIIEHDGKEMLRLVFETVIDAGWREMPKAWDSRMFRAIYKLYLNRIAPADRLYKRKTLLAYLEGKTPEEVFAAALIAYHKDPESAILELFTDVVKGKRQGRKVM